MNIIMNKFARRHTPASSFSHFNGTEEDFLTFVREHFSKGVQGYREGVLEVPVPPNRFFSPVVELTPESELKAIYAPRFPGEEPRIQVFVVGEKSLAISCKIILYSSSVLAENGENDLESVDGNWEVVSINASKVEVDEPINPTALTRNHCGDGTKSKMTAEQFEYQFRISDSYWKNRACVWTGN